MSGRLAEDATVLVGDPSEAGTVYGRGYFGTVGKDGLTLDRNEAVYLTEMGRLEVSTDGRTALPWRELLRRAMRAEEDFLVPYLVYRDLRQRGYVVRASPPPTRFAVLPRGGVLHHTPARFWVEPISERSPFDLDGTIATAERALAARKTLLLGVVDEESDLTYYRVGLPRPQGSREFRPPPEPWPAEVSDDRVELHEPPGVEQLGGGAGFGSRVGARLDLSLVEGAFLAERGVLALRSARTHRPIVPEQFRRRAARLDPDFGARTAVYAWLRDRGLVVKTGFKYGAHFRAYVRDPEQAHARYLIQATGPGWTAPWPIVAGHVRLAQGVRKEFLLARPESAGTVRCLRLERIRP